MAMHAKPAPTNPYNPSPLPAPPVVPSSNSNNNGVHNMNNNAEVRFPSPFIPIRIPVFAPVLWLNDQVVRVLSLGGVKTRRNSYTTGVGRKRGMSDSTVESVEEGSGSLAGVASTAHSTPLAPSSGSRVRVGRRKFD